MSEQSQLTRSLWMCALRVLEVFGCLCRLEMLEISRRIGDFCAGSVQKALVGNSSVLHGPQSRNILICVDAQLLLNIAMLRLKDMLCICLCNLPVSHSPSQSPLRTLLF